MFVRHHKSETIANVYWNEDRVNINSTDLECFLDIKNLRKSDSGKKKLNIIRKGRDEKGCLLSTEKKATVDVDRQR